MNELQRMQDLAELLAKWDPSSKFSREAVWLAARQVTTAGDGVAHWAPTLYASVAVLTMHPGLMTTAYRRMMAAGVLPERETVAKVIDFAKERAVRLAGGEAT